MFSACREEAGQAKGHISRWPLQEHIILTLVLVVVVLLAGRTAEEWQEEGTARIAWSG